MSVCDKIIMPAALGTYELHVTQNGQIDTVHGVHSVNGTQVETWTHADLVGNSPQTFDVEGTDRHVVQVFATFNDEDTFDVDLQHGGASVAECHLSSDGHDTSTMSILPPLGDQ